MTIDTNTILTIFAATMASSGFWALITKLLDKKDNKTLLLMGLGRDKIIYLGEKYIANGCMTKDEYEDYIKYLWEPYVKQGGNGLAKHMKGDIDDNVQILYSCDTKAVKNGKKEADD